ncbi:hypothetical protein L3Y34_011880 [Caenorhabditis briggsae]|uniref:Alpha-mannosidase n=1 Tax=Caenorhabditis briggsae TaxID=6238 RepID=A0AAE8ZXF0_CAEBR|nr:hypothetical protein L3Y34_011880 [Caenorhabditis briggsae]
MGKILFLLFLIKFSYAEEAQKCAWDNCHATDPDPNVITAHLIPHTHDDLGWIKTVDQYFWGAKPELVPVGVQYIYNTVVEELMKNPERRFSFAETGFLWRWWTTTTDKNREKFKYLIQTGQIEMIGGGWVQNDEATSHYVDILDQMTLGLYRLSHTFGKCGKPVTGWQIDPFGHSREMANIYAQMNYTSLYFARIHYLEKEVRLKNKTLEFNWKASDDIESEIFTGAFFNDNYGPPEGFCWDSLCGDDPIMDNEELEEYNVKEKVDDFVAHVKKQAAHQATNQVMLLMGSDFQYTNANSWYVNLDKLIKYVNADESEKVKVIYSTPACYTQAVKRRSPKLSTKADDFFPYASGKHSYWTGYFTSRPAFKGMIRQASSMLQLAKQLEALADLNPSINSPVTRLKEACGLVQHHDAVTGTAKENVTRDYEKQLARGISGLENVINDYMDKLHPHALKSNLILCPLLNETICQPISNSDEFAVVIFNSHARYYNFTVRIPYKHESAVVKNSKKEVIKSQVAETFKVAQLNSTDQLPYEIHAFVSIPPLGYSTVFVSKGERKVRKVRKNPSGNTTITNEHLIATFDNRGYLTSLQNRKTGLLKSIRQEFFFYEGIDSKDDQPSGAYIFRPKSQQPIAFDSKIELEVVKGSVTNEVRQKINPYVSQIVRLPKNKNYVEFEWIVGPIPKEFKNPVTKEFVTRYTTEINSKSVSYTDSNGRQVMKRYFDGATSFDYDDTEPVAGNYYPITSFGYIKDDKNQFSVITDRAQGMMANEGVVEIMLHRRCFYDDHFGVEEALDEPGKDGRGLVAKGKHIVLFTDLEESAAQLRPLVAENFHQPVLAFYNNSNLEKFEFNRQLESPERIHEFPPWLNFLTIEMLENRVDGKNNVLLRFEHIYHNDSAKAAKYAVPQILDLDNLFKSFKLDFLEKMTLGGNKKLLETGKNRFIRKKGNVYELHPSEILTLMYVPNDF